MIPRWLVAAVSSLAVALTALILGILPMQASAAEASYPVPANGVLTLSGRGYGHGAGMSQYGAKGGAEAGATATSILQTYYPGTAKLDIGNPTMRVALTRQGAEGKTCSSALPTSAYPCFRIRAQQGLRVRSTPTAGWWTPRLDNVTAFAVVRDSVNPTTKLEVRVRRNGVWQQWGPKNTAGPIEFKDTGGSALTLQYSNGTERAYRNTLRAVRTAADTLARVNSLPMELYLRGVVPAEMPASWPKAAVAAQAVAARTYAYADMKRDVSAPWHICDSTACQVYGGVGAESSTATDKFSATAGHVRVVAGKPITAFFASSNGGWSIDANASYLPARKDSWDPVNPWSRNISASCLESKYAVGRGSLVRFVVVRRDGHGQWGGRVREVRLEFVRGSVTVTGNGTAFSDDGALRKLGAGCGETAGLRSSWFTITSPAQAPSGPGVSGSSTGPVGAADVVTRAVDGSVSHRTWSPAAGFGSATGLGGATGFEPTLVSRPGGRLDVFVVGEDRALYVKSRITGTWGAWKRLGGALVSRPSATVVDETVQVVAAGTDRAVQRAVLDATGTSAVWGSLGGLVDPGSAPSATSAGPGRLDVVIQGGDSAVWSRHLLGGAWSGWKSRGGAVRGDPAVVANPDGSLVILATVPAGPLYARTLGGSGATGWLSLGGNLGGSPSAYVTTGRVDVLAEGTNAALYHLARTGTGWSSWSRA
ncbi:MAG: SpoIID/LytB domain-containing protein [Sporichthyaceae bacterium]